MNEMTLEDYKVAGKLADAYRLVSQSSGNALREAEKTVEALHKDMLTIMAEDKQRYATILSLALAFYRRDNTFTSKKDSNTIDS